MFLKRCARQFIRLIDHMFHYSKALMSDGPNYLIFFVTARCNLRCPHCFYLEEIESAVADKELTIVEIEQIARKSPNLHHITFTGGETFVRTDIDKIVKLFYRYSHTRSFTLTTNGTFPERVRDKVEAISKACPNAIIRIPLSLDGTEETHDIARGREGTWRKMMRTYTLMDQLVKKVDNIKLDVTSVLSQANEHNIEDLIDFVKNKLDIENHAIMYARGAIKDKEKILPAEVKYKELISKTFDRRKVGKYKFPLFSRALIYMREATESVIVKVQESNKMPFTCKAGERLIEMSEYGELFPCEILDTLISEGNVAFKPGFKKSWMGNIRDHGYSFRAVMESKKAKKVRDFIQCDGCACTFECAIGASLVFEPKNLWRLALAKSSARVTSKKYKEEVQQANQNT
ncbi:radical SAM protein [Bacteriovoracales bacterium]|nr:radical SAM protein [Bacteriovoracales bacterium]